MSEFKRDMDEIWIEIEKATDDIDVPDSLLPERIVEELKQNEKNNRNGSCCCSCCSSWWNWNLSDE